MGFLEIFERKYWTENVISGMMSCYLRGFQSETTDTPVLASTPSPKFQRVLRSTRAVRIIGGTGITHEYPCFW